MSEDEIKFYTVIKSNGVELPAVSNDIELSMSDIQASTLTSWVSGKTKLNPKRSDVVTLPMSWVNITIGQLNLILENTAAQQDGGSSVEFYDPITDTRITKRMYRSDRKSVMKLYKNGMYADLSFDFVEM